MKRIEWDLTPAGRSARRQYQNRRYARLHPESRRVKHLCTSCDEPGHNSRTCLKGEREARG